MELSFSPKYRIKKRREFLSFSRRDHHFSTRYLILQWKKTQYTNARLGITVAKRYGKAVERNQFKRRVREVFRLSSLRKLRGIDVQVRAIHKLPISFEEIRDAFLSALMTIEQ